MDWQRHIRLALAACALSVGVSANASAASRAHVVERGDTLWGLAQGSGCSVDDLRRHNGMDGDDALVVGRTLDLSKCNKATSTRRKSARRGDDRSRRYLVVAGDSLGKIAARENTSVAVLRELNDIEGSLIRVGQTLLLSGKAPRSIRLVDGQSRGRPGHGWLHRPAQLPRSGDYYRRRTERTFASAHLIDHTLNAVDAARAQFPKLHRLAIGDLSDEDGGSLSGHASHQSGRDIDIGFYFRRVPEGYPEEFVVATKDTLHADATWALLETFVRAAGEAGGVEKVFLDYQVQGWLYAAARRDGWSKRRLQDVFQYPDGRYAKHGMVRHEPNHADHLHVRVVCPPQDEHCK